MSDLGYREFHWLERGEGEPLLLLHGLMGRMDHWEGVLEVLGDVCRPIAPALPILDAVLREASIPELARFALDFLDVLEIPRAVIGGNSLGGHVALAVALAEPARVSGLVLTGSSGLLERGFSGGIPRRPTSDYVRQKMEEVVFDSTLVTPEWVESVREIVTTPFSALRVLRFARAARRHSVEDQLADVRVPALLVWGRNDRITPPDVARRFRSRLPDARLVFLPACGHAPMLEQPQAFAATVEEWLLATRPRRERAAQPAGSPR
jgi:pimeloyl-ACP methyl ester carboxylesterase